MKTFLLLLLTITTVEIRVDAQVKQPVDATPAKNRYKGIIGKQFDDNFTGILFGYSPHYGMSFNNSISPSYALNELLEYKNSYKGRIVLLSRYKNYWENTTLRTKFSVIDYINLDNYDRYSFTLCFHQKRSESSEVIVGVFTMQEERWLMQDKQWLHTKEHWLSKLVAAWRVDTIKKKFMKIDTTGVRCRVYSRGFD